MFVCFFFQAEDGIRDKLVTGVQTCALPISIRMAASEIEQHLREVPQGRTIVAYCSCPNEESSTWVALELMRLGFLHVHRSEERRVGKECRSRWSPYH